VGKGNLYAIDKRSLTIGFVKIFRLSAMRLRIRFGAAVKQKWNSCSRWRRRTGATPLRLHHCGITTPQGISPTGTSLMTFSAPVSMTLTLLDRPLAT
jgi:hypothetical protein